MVRNSLRSLALAALFVAGCGGTVKFTVVGADRFIGTDGEIRVTQIEGGAYEAQIELNHLPPPERIDSSLTTFVVWFQLPNEPTPRRVGALEFDDDGRTGRTRATTPGAQFRVLVTAESSFDVGVPSQYVVVQADVDAR